MSKANWFADQMRAVPGLTHRQRWGLARLLEAACNYGAGDALAGAGLLRLMPDQVKLAAELLKIPKPPSGSGPTVAMMLLSCQSEDATVTELLRKLDALATSGQGCGWWAGELRPEDGSANP